MKHHDKQNGLPGTMNMEKGLSVMVAVCTPKGRTDVKVEIVK